MATILCRPDGPYLVKELETLVDAAGAAIAHEAVFALCRCGGSAKKPFCDGTHKVNGFSGARLADGAADKVDTYRAGPVEIRDNRSICAHAGKCTDGLAAVFRYGLEPWIDPAAAEAATILGIVESCPSGALTCTVQGAAPAAPREARISVTRNGPYAVEGPVELIDARWAQGAARERYTLCRCGASKNKPFCDGSHWDAGFEA